MIPPNDAGSTPEIPTGAEGAPVVYRTGEDECLSSAVVSAVSHVSETDPVDLPPLYGSLVDPDALDALFSGFDAGDRRGTLTFPYAGYDVTVRSDGTVVVEV